MDNSEDLEIAFDQFLDKMQKVDRRLSVQTQKILLREATKDAVKSLRVKTRTSWHKRTGDASKSIKAKVGTSSVDKNQAYVTWGWRNKGIPDRRKYSIKNYSDAIAPKPATYIGIWQDLGTQRGIKAKHIFRNEWNVQKPKISKTIQDAIEEILKLSFKN